MKGYIGIMFRLMMCTTVLFTLSSFTTIPPGKSVIHPDSLVIVRVLRPIDPIIPSAPVMYISKGKGKVDRVEMTDLQGRDHGKVIKTTIDDLLAHGYTLQSATESTEQGIRLSTFYFKKRVV